MKIKFTVDYEPDPNLNNITIEFEITDTINPSLVNERLLKFISNLRKEIGFNGVVEKNE